MNNIEVLFKAPKADVKFYPDGLNSAEQRVVKFIATQLFQLLERTKPSILPRCNWFAENGYNDFVALVNQHPELSDPRIEGCDSNCTDQHYWLAADLDNKEIAFDPIFGYVGDISKAGKLIHYAPNYYNNKRRCVPGVHRSKGGVMINTMGI